MEGRRGYGLGAMFKWLAISIPGLIVFTGPAPSFADVTGTGAHPPAGAPHRPRADATPTLRLRCER